MTKNWSVRGLLAIAGLLVASAALAQRVAVLGGPNTASWNNDVQSKLVSTGLFPGGVDIINNDNSHGGTTIDTNVVFAAAGLYPIEITYFNGDWTSDGTASTSNAALRLLSASTLMDQSVRYK